MEEVQRVRLPRGREIFGIVESKAGGNKFVIRCQDNKVRLCRVPGRLKKRMWLKIGSAVIVEPWEIQGDKRGDVLWQYTNTQHDWLRRNNHIKI